MTKFRCSNCRYVFETELQPRLCPNCGDRRTVSKEKNAEELILDID